MLPNASHFHLVVAYAAGVLVGLRPISSSASSLTLAEAVSRALAQSGQARQVSLATERAAHEAEQAHSSFRPQVGMNSAAGYSSRQTEKLRAVDGRGVERVYGLASLGSRDGWFNFFVEQLLFDLRRSKEIEAADLALRAAEAVEAQRRESIASDVLELYADMVRIDEKLRVVRDVADRAAALRRVASSLADAGSALDVDREDASIAAERAALAVDDLVRQRTMTGEELSTLIGGRPDDLPEPLVASLPDPVEKEPPESWDEVLEGSPEMRALDIRRRLERVRAEAARAGRLPTVGLRGGYSHYGTNRYDDFPDEWHIGVDLRVPLFDGGRTRHAAAAARNSEQIAEIEYEQALVRKHRRVSELYFRLGATERSEQLAVRSERNALRRLELAEMRLRAKRGAVVEVVSALDHYRAAALAAVDGRFERLRAWAALERELGRLSSRLIGSGMQ